MIEEIDKSLTKYRRLGTIIDSNLLLLYFVGACDKNIICSFKRTKMYTIDDYNLLSHYVNQFQFVTTTPSILTEVSGFLNQLSSNMKPAFYDKFSSLLSNFNEKHSPSSELSLSDSFSKFGLTDTGIIEGAKKHKMLVLTDDFRLSGYLNSRNIDAINFNNIRMLGWN